MKELLAIFAGIVALLGYFFNPKATKKRRLKKYYVRIHELDSKMIGARKANNEELWNQLNSERETILDEIEALGI